MIYSGSHLNIYQWSKCDVRQIEYIKCKINQMHALNDYFKHWYTSC